MVFVHVQHFDRRLMGVSVFDVWGPSAFARLDTERRALVVLLH